MSKTAMAKASAREQMRSSVALAQSEAESQHQLQRMLEHVVLSMATVTTDLTEMMETHQELAKETTGRVQTAMAQGITSLQAGISEIQTISKQLAKALKTAMERTSDQTSRFRLAALAMTFVAGLMAGVILLSSLLIWQPPLIQRFWTVAQALRN